MATFLTAAELRSVGGVSNVIVTGRSKSSRSTSDLVLPIVEAPLISTIQSPGLAFPELSTGPGQPSSVSSGLNESTEG